MTEDKIFAGDFVSYQIQLCSPHGDIRKYLNSLMILKKYSTWSTVYSSSRGTYFTQEILDSLIALTSGILQDNVVRVGQADSVVYYEGDGVSIEIDAVLLEHGREDAGVDELSVMMMGL
jgi:hypothetical protein